MNRLSTTILRRRLSPRVTVVSGAALGLIAGVAVYSAMSSSAEVIKPVASTVVKPPVAAAPANFAACAAGSKLEKGVCVIRVVKTVVGAPSSSGPAAQATSPAGAQPAGVAKPGAAAAPGTSRTSTPAASAATSSAARDGEDAPAAAQLSPKDAAVLAAKNAAALAAKDAATLGADNPTTLAANKAATAAAKYAATFSAVRDD